MQTSRTKIKRKAFIGLPRTDSASCSFFLTFGFHTEGHETRPHQSTTSSNTLETSSRLRDRVGVVRSLAWHNVAAVVVAADRVVVAVAPSLALMVDLVVVRATVVVAALQTAAAPFQSVDLCSLLLTGWPVVDRPVVVYVLLSCFGLAELEQSRYHGLLRAVAIAARFEVGELVFQATIRPSLMPFFQIFLANQRSLAPTIHSNTILFLWWHGGVLHSWYAKWPKRRMVWQTFKKLLEPTWIHKYP
jgi:hypothetical protein